MGRGGFSSSRGSFRNYGYGQKREYANYEQEEEKYGETEGFEHGNGSSRGGFSSSRGSFRNYGYGQKREYGNYEQEEEKYGETEEFEHRNANRQPLQKRPKIEESEDGTPRAPSAIRQKFEKAKMKEWRIIVRNLPFKTKKEDLQNVCSNFGPFAEIVLPPSKKNPKTSAGFGFIQFLKKEDAEKAREHLNSNKFLGRAVAADWALDKDTYETNAHEEKEHLKKVVKVEKDDEKKGNKSKKFEDSDEEKEEGDEEAESDDSEGSDNESGEESDDFEDEDDESGDKKSKKSKKSGKSAPKKEQKTDEAITKGKVVFLRNLSFETKEEMIKEELGKFGKIDLAIICKYKDSGHSKGTAFVHFSTPLEASNCIEGVEDGIIIDNRLVKANLAIPRKEAADMEKDKLTKVPKDRRNLRLARFGLIRDGTAAAAGMSKEDAGKREKLAEAMRKKLENTNMFISPVRLCIHNLPQKINDQKLKELALKSASAGAVITECRVWMDKKRLTADGKPKSSGFGFVAFKEHMHALEALKKLNNNPDTFTKDRRPIVEFSVENLLALQARARRNVKNTTEKMSERVVNEKIRQQVKQSIGEVHTAGMKFLPKFTGKKIRHRNLSGRAKKNVDRVKAAKNTKQPEMPASKAGKKKSIKNVANSDHSEPKSKKNHMLPAARRFFSFSSLSAAMANVHGFTVKNAKGEDTPLSKYSGKVLIIVNVASECGLTNSNYTQLKELLDQYKKDGLEVLAFPCNQFGGQEPSCEIDIKAFVADKFKFEPELFQKINVNGDDADPLYKFLKNEKGGFLVDAIKWNFTKFLVGRDGNVIKRFSPTTEPKDMKKEIEAALQAKL